MTTPTPEPAPPQLGDIVVYVGGGPGVWAQRRASEEEFIVASHPDAESGEVYCVEVGQPYEASDYCYMKPGSLRVVRRASYRTVDE